GTGVVYSHEFDNPHEFLTAAIDAATPTGTCIREDVADTTNDSSSFVPHYVEGPAWTAKLPVLSARQRELYESLYPQVDDSYAGHVQRYFGYGGGGGSGVPVTSPN
ncbi:hypothetical protein DYB38_013082, partial [Aphanomyces astaci]